MRILKGYDYGGLGDREFQGVGLANWLDEENVAFALRQKAHTYIQPEAQAFQQLNSLELAPGMKKFITGVKVTKSQGFGDFNIACHWKRKYQSRKADEPWYILTNLGSLKETLTAYKARSGIEAMFKDCKTGGYNLEGSRASVERLTRLVLLRAIADTTSALQGLRIKQLTQQKYIARLQELKRQSQRHSNFWIGHYGFLWVASMEFWCTLASEFMRNKPHKLPFFQRGQHALTRIQTAF